MISMWAFGATLTAIPTIPVLNLAANTQSLLSLQIQDTTYYTSQEQTDSHHTGRHI